MKNRNVYRPKKIKKPVPEGVKTAFRWIVYTIIAFLLFAFSTQGDSSVPKAIVLFPLAFAIAVFESEVPSAVTGTVCGLLIDISTDKLLGFTAFYMCVLCGLMSALFRQFLRKNIISYIAITAALTGIYLYVDYYLFYKIWGEIGYETVLKTVLLPSWLKTVLWSPLVFFAVWLFDRITGPERRLVIEATDKNIDRI